MNGRSATRAGLRPASWAPLVGALAFISVAAVATDRTPEAGAALQQQLEHSPFSEPLYVESFEDADASSGDVYAVVDYPIATVSDSLTSPDHWCEVLILHLNVKYCHPVSRDGRTLLSVAIGRKHEQPLHRTFRVEFDYSVAASRPGYLDVALNAGEGPLGTGDYRISFEAVSVAKDHSFVHVRYSYSHDAAARAAMQVYLATTGRGKVGFTKVAGPNGQPPQYVSGVRGASERNAMRYYLAIDAYLGSLRAPASERFEQSLQRWFAATERYPRQLHEIDRDTYLEMKRGEYQRQQAIQ